MQNTEKIAVLEDCALRVRAVIMDLEREIGISESITLTVPLSRSLSNMRKIISVLKWKP